MVRLSAALSNSTSRGTGMPVTKALFGQRIREGLDLARIDNDTVVSIDELNDDLDGQAVATERNEDLDGQAIAAHPAVPDTTPAPARQAVATEYRPTHINAKDAIALAAITMKAQYDARYEPKFFEVGDWVSLRLHRGYTVPGLKDRNHKIEQQFAGPFEIIEKVNRLSYRLRLPPSMSRISPVISIAHLEPATHPSVDPFNRRPDIVHAPALTPDGRVNRLPERLLRRRMQTRRNGGVAIQYLVRFKDLGAEYDQWMLDRSLPHELTRAFDRPHQQQLTAVRITSTD